MDIIRGFSLSKNQYFQEQIKKDLIVLHHTVGASAESSILSWEKDKSRIATAYVIDRDGRIYETFPPEYWGYHLGVKDRFMDKRSIGIELANWGPLYLKNGKFKTVYGSPYEGGVYDNQEFYRHSQYFEPYPLIQMAALSDLLNYLFKRFPGIPRDTPRSKETDFDRFRRYRGILGHFHVRKGKSDVHPGFNWNQIINDCRLHID